jgi:hypothetical protein
MKNFVDIALTLLKIACNSIFELHPHCNRATPLVSVYIKKFSSFKWDLAHSGKFVFASAGDYRCGRGRLPQAQLNLSHQMFGSPPTQWRSQTLFFFWWGSEAHAEGLRPSRGFRAHAPTGKCWNLESLKCDFKHFWDEILQNSEDYKVHRRLESVPGHFYSELYKLEKSSWKTGGGVSVTLFLLCDAGGENPNVILIRNVAFKSF